MFMVTISRLDCGWRSGGFAEAFTCGNVLLNEPSHAVPEYREWSWFLQIIGGALLQGLCGLLRAHHNHIDGRIHLPNAPQHLEAAHARHDQVRYDNLRLVQRNELQSIFRR